MSNNSPEAELALDKAALHDDRRRLMVQQEQTALARLQGADEEFTRALTKALVPDRPERNDDALRRTGP